MLLSATDDGSFQPVLEMVRDKLTKWITPIPSGGWIRERRPHPVPLRATPSWSTPTPCPARSAPAAATQGQRPRRPGILEGVLTFLDAAVQARTVARPSAQRNDADVTAQPGRAG